MNQSLKYFILPFFTVFVLFAQQKESISLAVNDLSPQGVKKSEAMVISEQLRTELSKYPKIRLIERSQMDVILQEQGFQQTGCTSDACAVEAGQLLGVSHIAVGSVGKAGSYTVLTVRILNVATGEIIANTSIQTRGGIDEVIEVGIKKIVVNINKKLFPSEKSKTPVVKKKNNSIGKILLIGGGGLALVAGGVAAYFLWPSNSNAPSNQEGEITPNVRIELP